MSDTPQAWADLLQEEQVDSAWRSLSDAEPNVDSAAAPVYDRDMGPILRDTPDFLVVTHLREENEQELS
ncbi:hypothetical protein JOE61_003142 [Nocardioides salarius]|uniref:Uncharacterized protein n=1 Tax=Nocardioides salarius TaxID=374513 RepID=A0ABS2MDR5_9ACTN|nr:hypothetical protein [Nocardioides salarius]MBM7509328.1 hypothetical protein [Nocardioides salarius]